MHAWGLLFPHDWIFWRKRRRHITAVESRGGPPSTHERTCCFHFATSYVPHFCLLTSSTPATATRFLHHALSVWLLFFLCSFYHFTHVHLEVFLTWGGVTSLQSRLPSWNLTKDFLSKCELTKKEITYLHIIVLMDQKHIFINLWKKLCGAYS